MSRLRDLVNASVLINNQDKLGFVWDMVCASMDTLGDTQLAIDAVGDGQSNDGQRYLEIYGLFQAFFLQQDALVNLAAGLNLGRIDILNGHFSSIRDLRNKYFGHPTKRDRPAPTTYHGLSRITISSNQITGWTYPNFSTEVIDIADTVDQQEQGALAVLTELHQRLLNKRKEYVMTFDGQTLPTDKQSYEFEKLGAWAVDPGSDNREAMASISLDVIRAKLAEIKDGIARRYDDAGGPGDIDRIINKAEFCIDHLGQALTRQAETEFENEIYVDALRRGYRDIVEHCVAINEDFSVDGQVEG
jgi:hypothetical protein